MSAIDEIKARIDVVELISETVKLRRTGKNYIGFCPFHANTRTPSFVVFP
ncbi:MAG: CHC2 zinc finger domain-containing protein, partial [Bellilinea sp.]